MAARSLDLRIMKNGFKYGEVTITADPNDTPALQATLKNWLEGRRWDKKLWNQFSAEVQYDGKLRKVVRL